ncbi:hypothetical protein PONTUS_85 [Vibrio phage Pontus]|uniref:Uncharacterized protein n=1 Tax=Vibrio phage Pontus TaxID=2590874 RepID=A0A4Y6E8B5_9CAUD|nr:hypothetical protein KNU59_gp085 [Vibrio phage Pontus]QDF14734.1 hypothetical protein PONTUS_85 [Vibrio phage Pontus]WBU76326.1 hypothetical protein WYMAN_87 [Vibrio phage Wyman]
MAKKPAKTVNTATTERNKARRLARHVKAHPNDAQSAARVGKPRSVRKAPFVKGSFRKVNKAYRDEAGHVLEAPRFAPVAKQA